MDNNFNWYIGIDEVGRGPLAGPVTLCAVAFKTREMDVFNGIKDSKKLSEKKRVDWLEKIEIEKGNGNIFYSLSSSDNNIIDSKGISLAIKDAIKNCLIELNLEPQKCFVLLDGSLKAPVEYVYQETIIKGDEKEQIIGVASVIAKVKRDELLCEYSKKYPEYGMEKHKGYGTKAHYEAIKKHGLCGIHRRSYLRNVI